LMTNIQPCHAQCRRCGSEYTCSDL